MNTLTEELARAAGWDAGNRSMYQHGRHQWDCEDVEAATKEFCRLMRILEPGIILDEEPGQ